MATPSLSRMSLSAAYAHCAAVARRSDSNFLAAFWLFPRDQRHGLHAVYAFCRLADDIADGPEIDSDRRKLLEDWRELLEDAYLEKSEHPVGMALGDTVHRFQLQKDWFEELLAGIECDLNATPLDRFEDVERYAFRVASTVGSMVLGLRGERGEDVEAYARHLGIGVQLTNILRDVRDDAAEGRCYFAQEDLARFGVDPASLVHGGADPAVRQMIECYADRARTHYSRSQEVLPRARRDALRPAQAIGAIYRDLLARLEASDFLALASESRPSKARRIAVAARSWWTGELT